MKITDCIETSIIALVCLLMGCNGCASDTNQSRNAPGTRGVPGAFSNAECPYLFMSGQHRGLEDILGSSLPKDFLAGVEHTSDGRMLRIRNYHRTQYYILEVGREPRIVDTPAGAFLNRDNQVILRCEDLGRGKVLFPNGLWMHIPSFVVDADGQYLCVGGAYYDSEAKTRKEIPITIRSIDMPEKVVATSRMSGILEKSLCFHDKLYLCVRQYPEKGGTGRMACEVYRRQGGEVVLAESMTIESPLALSDFVIVEDVCPGQAHAILFANRHPPLGSRRYLFDMKTQKTHDLGLDATQYTGFLDRQVFDQLLDKADSRPVHDANWTESPLGLNCTCN